MLTCLLILASPPVVPQAIERQASYSYAANDSSTTTPGTGVSFTNQGVAAVIYVGLSLPGELGVEHIRTDIEASIISSFEMEFFTLDPIGTRFSGVFGYSSAICSGSCSWGSFGQGVITQELGDPLTPIAPGLQTTFVEYGTGGPTAMFYNTSIGPTDVNWSALHADPSFQVFATLGSLRMDTFALDHSPTSVRLDSFTAEAAASLDIVNTFELSFAPSIEYCTSPVSASGVAATLQTYGSQVEDTEFLTVAASGLPDQSFAILFVGTSAVSQPLGSNTLCVGGSVRRMGGVAQARSGTAEFPIDLLGRVSGERLYLQSFFRDPVVGVAASNASTFTVAPRL